MNMTARKVSVWYDDEGDMLEVLWALREGYFTPTDDERILKRLDDRGEVIGFLIHEVSTLRQGDPIEFDLEDEAPPMTLRTSPSSRLLPSSASQCVASGNLPETGASTARSSRAPSG